MRPAVARRSRSLPFLALAAAAIALGCSDESSIGPKKVVSVRITPDTVRLVVGEVDTVRGFAIDEDGAFLANKRVDWTSSNPSVATVDADGTVTGISLGEADISATVGSVGATSKILVAPAPDTPSRKTRWSWRPLPSRAASPPVASPSPMAAVAS